MRRGCFCRGLCLALLLCLLLFCRCFAQEEAQTAYELYYLDHDETILLTTPYLYEDDSTDDLLRQLMTRLNEKERQQDGRSLLPGEVMINSYTISDGVLDLEFSEAYRNMDYTREILLRAGVVFTFVQVPQISKVSFRIGAEPLKDLEGNEVGPMDASDFADLGNNTSGAYRYDSFVLYFASRDGNHLVEEKRNVYYRRSLRRERVIVEQLAKGPMEKDHYPSVSANTLVNDIQIYDGVCHLDLNGAYVDYQEDVPARTAVYSVVNSLIASGDISSVRITVDGNEKRMMDDAVSLNRYYRWNSKIMEEKTDAESED